MKSLLSRFPGRALRSLASNAGLEETKSRLLRVVVRHQPKKTSGCVLSPSIAPAGVGPTVLVPEPGIRPLYDQSVYLSSTLDDDDFLDEDE